MKKPEPLPVCNYCCKEAKNPHYCGYCGVCVCLVCGESHSNKEHPETYYEDDPQV